MENAKRDTLEMRDRLLLIAGNLFFTPIVGFVAWFILKKDQPGLAKEILTVTFYCLVILWTPITIMLLVGLFNRVF